MYDNETMAWLYDEDLIDDPRCDWYDDEDMGLYILPSWDSDEENVGPDGPIMDAIMAIAHYEKRNPTREEAEALGLQYVDHVLRRFNEIDGYYHA